MVRNKQEMITMPMNGPYCFTFEQLNIISLFQRLFTQLAVFMRGYINASAHNQPGLTENSERLMKVPTDFRNAFLLFYGPEIADRMTNLMTNFIAMATNIAEGYASDSEALLNQSTQNWYRSVDEFAAFLASINLFWIEEQWKNLLYQYVQLKLNMIGALFAGDYEQEIQVYERVFDLTSIMGTYMARGLIARELHRLQSAK